MLFPKHLLKPALFCEISPRRVLLRYIFSLSLNSLVYTIMDSWCRVLIHLVLNSGITHCQR
jgi:hypothetical protein